MRLLLSSRVVDGQPSWLRQILVVAVLMVMCCSFWQSSALANELANPEVASPALANTGWASPLQIGNEGAAVTQLQTRLKTLGYLEKAVTGTYDEATQAAVLSFQQDRGIGIDGVVGAQTQQQLAEPGSQNNSARAEMPPDIQRIFDRGKLVVALLGRDNPPFFMSPDSTSQDNNTPTGLDIKIAQGLADELGVALEFNRSPQTFNEVVDQVYQLNADIAISKLSRTFSRAKRVQFSRPYVTMRQGLLVNRLQLAEQTQGNRVVEAIRNFQGKVGVIQGSSYGNFIKQKFPDAIIEEYPTWEDTVTAVMQGDIQAAYRDELEVKKVILQNPDAALRLQTIALNDTKDQIAMALPWDSYHFQAFVNQYLETLDLDYSADLVLDEYAEALQPASPKG